MSALVVDASVAAKWFLPEEHSGAALRVLSDENRLHAPDLLPLEVDGVLSKKVRRAEISAREGSRIREALSRFPIRLHPFDGLRDPAWRIAGATRATVYDCVYVALAALLGMRVVTADLRLFRSLARGPFSDLVVWVEDLT